MKLLGLVGAIFFSVLTSGCGASDASEEPDEETTEGALLSQSASDLFKESMVVEISTGGTEAERNKFADILNSLSAKMTAKVKNLPPVNGRALGPDLNTQSLRFIAKMPMPAALNEPAALDEPAALISIPVKGALAKELLTLVVERTTLAGLPACKVKEGVAQCDWQVVSSRVQIKKAERGSLTDDAVARLMTLAYAPQK